MISYIKGLFKQLIYLRSLLISSLSLGLIVCWWMKSWFGAVLPLSPREENIPELSYIWSLYHAAKQKVLLADWNPLFMTGVVNLIQRGYVIFAPTAYFSFLFHMSPDNLYKILVGLIFFSSGLGMFFYLKSFKLNSISSLIGGFSYMFAPAHLAIGIEGFDFNIYWALIPWLMLTIEYYINNNKLLQQASLLAFLLTTALFAGNTYFVATMPLFFIFIFLRLKLKKAKKISQFLFFSLLMFVLFSAFITLPSLMEAKYSWISQVTQRKLIVNLPSLKQLISLFPQRIKGYSVLAFNYKGNFTDMSWYLGLSQIGLALIAISAFKKNWRLTLPFLFLLFVLLPFYLVTLWPFKNLALTVLTKIPRLQAVYDHTFRMFLPIVFSLSVLTAFGYQVIIKKFSHKWHYLVLTGLLGLVIADFYPYRLFFRSMPMSNFAGLPSVLLKINNSAKKGRFWAPFPYVWHLPKYRYEYFTRYLTRPRLNSQFLYIPFSPRYSAEAFEEKLIGALEAEKQTVDFVATMLDWGNVDYIVLYPAVADYTKAIKELKKYLFLPTVWTDRIIILERKESSKFIRLYQTFAQVPENKKAELFYWYNSYKKNLPLVAGETSFIDSTVKSATFSGKILKWDRPTSQQINIKAKVNKPALLTVSESWFPGWQAIIDGHRKPLLRANYALLGVVVPQGEHLISFIYQQPWYYQIGKLISIISITSIIIWLGLKILPQYVG